MKWRNSLSVGHKPFDDDLKILFNNIDKTIYKLIAARNHLAVDANSLMDELKQLFIDSFEKQEVLMEKLKFDGYYQHKHQHETFLNEIEAMRDILLADEFSAGSNVAHINTHVSQWIVLHIATLDNEFGAYYLKINHLPRYVYEEEPEDEIKVKSTLYQSNGKVSKLQMMMSATNNTTETDIPDDNANVTEQPSKLERLMAYRQSQNADLSQQTDIEPILPDPKPSKLEKMMAYKNASEQKENEMPAEENQLYSDNLDIYADTSADNIPPVLTEDENIFANIQNDSDIEDIFSIIDNDDPFSDYGSTNATSSDGYSDIPFENTISEDDTELDFASPFPDFSSDDAASPDVYSDISFENTIPEDDTELDFANPFPEYSLDDTGSLKYTSEFNESPFPQFNDGENKTSSGEETDSDLTDILNIMNSIDNEK